MRTQTGSFGIFLLILQLSVDGVSGQINASASLPPRSGALCGRGWVASRADLYGGCGEGKNLLPPTKFDPRTVHAIA